MASHKQAINSIVAVSSVGVGVAARWWLAPKRQLEVNSLSDSLIVELFQEQAYDTRVLIDKEDGHSKGWANHAVELLLQEQANKALVKRLVEQIFHAALLRYDIEMENELEELQAMIQVAQAEHAKLHAEVLAEQQELADRREDLLNNGFVQQEDGSWGYSQPTC